MPAMKTLNDLFVHTLKDIYYAERQIMKSLPKMIKKAGTPELKQALENHMQETEGQIERLQQVFEMINKPARGVKCEAIEGIIAEGESLMEEIEDKEVGDAGILASAQAVEHYEISRYGTLISWAEQLQMQEAAKLLQETLDEEKKADKLLTQIAESSINKKAA